MLDGDTGYGSKEYVVPETEATSDENQRTEEEVEEFLQYALNEWYNFEKGEKTKQNTTSIIMELDLNGVVIM